MQLRLAVVMLSAMAGIAGANPPQSCRDLADTTYARLPPAIQQKLASVTGYAHGAKWRNLVVRVDVARAPHIAREVLTACPGVVRIDDANPNDERHFHSQVQLHASSFAALVRIAQLPAVAYISAYDPTAPRMRHPEPEFIDFE